MTPTQLLKHFDRLAEAPDAVPRLRRFILDLAVRGKLVEQDPSNEPASELLKRIQAKKAGLVKKGTIKSLRECSADVPEETSFPLPLGWMQTHLGAITNVIMGQSPPGSSYNKIGEGVPLINGPVEFTEGPFGRTVVNQYTTEPTNYCDRDDLLICVRGSTTGRTNIAAFRACIGRGLAAIQPMFEDQFVRLRVCSLRQQIIEMGRGIAFPSVSRNQVEMLVIPLPPLAEQRRIVAKVDELMGLCDRLEAAQAEREQRRDRLAAASLNRLNRPDDAKAFRADAGFHLCHLPRFTVRPDQIPALRQTILNLAVRGRLVQQDPKDEPACELLARIQIEKAKLAKNGEYVTKTRPRTTGEAIGQFGIPETWQWVSLGEIAFGFRYGTSVKCAYEPTGEPVLRIPNVANGVINTEDLKYGPLARREADDLRLRIGDILMVRSNGSLNLVGRPAPIDTRVIGFCYAGYLVRVRTSAFHLDTRYIVLALTTTHVREQIEIPIRTTVGLKNVNVTELSGLTFPLPPFAEQHRIVAKVDELMAVCDRLELQLTTAQTESRHLLESVLCESLANR